MVSEKPIFYNHKLYTNLPIFLETGYKQNCLTVGKLLNRKSIGKMLIETFILIFTHETINLCNATLKKNFLIRETLVVEWFKIKSQFVV